MIRNFVVSFVETFLDAEGLKAKKKTETFVNGQLALDMLLTGFDRSKFELMGVTYVGDELLQPIERFLPNRRDIEKGI